MSKFVFQEYEFAEHDGDDPKKKIHLQIWDTAGQERFIIVMKLSNNLTKTKTMCISLCEKIIQSHYIVITRVCEFRSSS